MVLGMLLEAIKSSHKAALVPIGGWTPNYHASRDFLWFFRQDCKA